MSSTVADIFDAMAATYDDLEPWYEHFYARLHAILRAELGQVPPAGRALDAGCGTGFQSAILTDLGWTTHGIDLSAGLLAVARQRLYGAGQLAIERAGAQAADDDADAMGDHVRSSGDGDGHHASRSAAATMSSSPGKTRNAAPASGV